jgi:hypothetical protein
MLYCCLAGEIRAHSATNAFVANVKSPRTPLLAIEWSPAGLVLVVAFSLFELAAQRL